MNPTTKEQIISLAYELDELTIPSGVISISQLYVEKTIHLSIEVFKKCFSTISRKRMDLFHNRISVKLSGVTIFALENCDEQGNPTE